MDAFAVEVQVLAFGEAAAKRFGTVAR